jgi:beta-lactam-binding protein with PASTA domain
MSRIVESPGRGISQPVVTPPAPFTPPPAIVCLVPKLGWLTLAKAQLSAQHAHCKLSVMKKIHRQKIALGKIVSQSPKPGSKLAENVTVEVVVSLGPVKNAKGKKKPAAR